MGESGAGSGGNGQRGSVSQRLSVEGADPLTLAGVNDANLLELTRLTGAKISMRADMLTLTGAADVVERAAPVAQRMIEAARQRLPLDADDVLRMSLEVQRDGTGANGEMRVVLPGMRKIIQPKTPGQAEYLQSLRGSLTIRRRVMSSGAPLRSSEHLGPQGRGRWVLNGALDCDR